MKHLPIALSAMLLSHSALALEGFNCKSENGAEIIKVRLIDDVQASVEESANAGSTYVADYRRILVSEEPYRALTTFYLEGNRNLDVIENGEDVIGVMVLRQYQIVKYFCEALR